MIAMKSVSKYWPIFVVGGLFIFIFSFRSAFAVSQEEINQKNQQIEEIQRQIQQYQQQIDTIHSQAQTLQGQIKTLDAQINQITLEIKSLGLSISKTNLEILNTEDGINVAEQKIQKDQQVLGQYLRLVYQKDHETLTSILLKNDTISEFFNDLNSVKTNQDNLKVTIDGIQKLQEVLLIQKEELEEKKADLEQQQRLEQIDKRSLDQSKTQKASILKQTQGQESKFQDLVKRSKNDIARIQQEIYYLNQNGVSVEDAIKYGNLAAIAADIRPAFLLAELEIESGLGQNVGRCNRAGDPPSKGYRMIMKPDRDIQPFLTITSQLGMDPEMTAVSCPQYVNGKRYGWGGAMGPAQFIPSTWMGYTAQVASIVGRPANPWNIQDAFTAAALKLARGGAAAKTRASEVAASKTYYSGNSKCATAACNSYANSVQRTAAELEKSL